MLKCWNLSSTQFVNAINKILNPARPQLDKLVWIVDLKAQFSTKLALQITTHLMIQSTIQFPRVRPGSCI